MAVWTDSSRSLSDFMPKYCATTTLPPAERPRKMLTMRLLSELVEPTAAMALPPANWPSTMMSAELNSSCRMPESISGMEKRSRLPMMGPLHRSIVISFFNVFTPEKRKTALYERPAYFAPHQAQSQPFTEKF